MKKLIAVLLSVLLIAALSGPVFADDIVPYSSDQFTSTAVVISAQSNGQIALDCKTIGTGLMTSIGMTKIVIYEKADDTWSIKETRLLANNPNWMAYNAYWFGTTEWCQGTPGNDYYAKVTFQATNSKGTDSRVYTSAIVTAKS